MHLNQLMYKNKKFNFCILNILHNCIYETWTASANNGFRQTWSLRIWVTPSFCSLQKLPPFWGVANTEISIQPTLINKLNWQIQKNLQACLLKWRAFTVTPWRQLQICSKTYTVREIETPWILEYVHHKQ